MPASDVCVVTARRHIQPLFHSSNLSCDNFHIIAAASIIIIIKIIIYFHCNQNILIGWMNYVYYKEQNDRMIVGEG